MDAHRSVNFIMAFGQRNSDLRGAFIDSDGHHAGDAGTVRTIKHLFDVSSISFVVEVAVAVEDVHVVPVMWGLKFNMVPISFFKATGRMAQGSRRRA